MVGLPAGPGSSWEVALGLAEELPGGLGLCGRAVRVWGPWGGCPRVQGSVEGQCGGLRLRGRAV